MVAISCDRIVPAPQQRVWDVISDVSTFEHWHALHEGWEEMPSGPIDVGSTMVEKIKVAALVDTITFEVKTCRTPSEVVFRGAGSTGSKIHMRLGLEPTGETTTVTIDLDVTSPLLVGPIGKALNGTFTKRLRQTLDGLATYVASVDGSTETPSRH